MSTAVAPSDVEQEVKPSETDAEPTSEATEETVETTASESAKPDGAAAAPNDAWAKLEAALASAGVAGDASGADGIKVEEVVEKFLTPDQIAKQPPGVRVALRAAASLMADGKKTIADERAKFDADRKKAQDDLARARKDLDVQRAAFLDIAGNEKLLAQLRDQARGADRADTTTEEGRRKVFAQQQLSAMSEWMAPFREQNQVVKARTEWDRLQAEYPGLKDEEAQKEVFALIDTWDAEWLKAGGEKTNRPPPSAGRLQEAVTTTLLRRTQAAAERQRASERAARVSAASHVTTTTGGRGGGKAELPTAPPKTYKGGLWEDPETRMKYREENPEAWKSIVAHARGA